MDRKILAIGGSVIKTARLELYRFIEQQNVEMLIHNGGSLFHDFQLATEDLSGKHSHSLVDLLENYRLNKKASKLVWRWVGGLFLAPPNSITALCERMSIPILLFTTPGADFWHIFHHNWNPLAKLARESFDELTYRFQNPFHYVCMGSAVTHPEVFIKAIAIAKPKHFRADVVDFMDMYRPRTRVARYGKYYLMTHKEYLRKCLQ